MTIGAGLLNGQVRIYVCLTKTEMRTAPNSKYTRRDNVVNEFDRQYCFVAVVNCCGATIRTIITYNDHLKGTIKNLNFLFDRNEGQFARNGKPVSR